MGYLSFCLKNRLKIARMSQIRPIWSPWGQCYDHNFRRKKWRFLINQCYDNFLHNLALFSINKRQFFRKIFRQKYFKYSNIGP
jgi:hypothetical protein